MAATGGVSANCSYDGAGRLTQITGQAGSPVTMAYDGAGRRTSLRLPNGVTVTYGYDAGLPMREMSK